MYHKHLFPYQRHVQECQTFHNETIPLGFLAEQPCSCPSSELIAAPFKKNKGIQQRDEIHALPPPTQPMRNYGLPPRRSAKSQGLSCGSTFQVSKRLPEDRGRLRTARNELSTILSRYSLVEWIRDAQRAPTQSVGTFMGGGLTMRLALPDCRTRWGGPSELGKRL
jgi:hypothetical protein